MNMKTGQHSALTRSSAPWTCPPAQTPCSAPACACCTHVVRCRLCSRQRARLLAAGPRHRPVARVAGDWRAGDTGRGFVWPCSRYRPDRCTTWESKSVTATHGDLHRAFPTPQIVARCGYHHVVSMDAGCVNSRPPNGHKTAVLHGVPSSRPCCVVYRWQAAAGARMCAHSADAGGGSGNAVPLVVPRAASGAHLRWALLRCLGPEQLRARPRRPPPGSFGAASCPRTSGASRAPSRQPTRGRARRRWSTSRCGRVVGRPATHLGLAVPCLLPSAAAHTSRRMVSGPLSKHSP